MLFALLPLLSIGFLTWGTMIRLAVVTRRARDWVLCGVSAAVMITGMILLPDDVETTQADIAMGLILLNAVAFTVYFLVVDIKHDRIRLGGAVGQGPAAPYNPYAATVPRHQSGHVSPAQAHPHPHPQPHSHPQPIPAQPVVPPQPPAQPTPANPRIDQVRAELDELSNLLRKDEGK
ncbi:hypothetical protein ACIPPS_29820 [Streptomyces sp. NPDC090127]|uniref:hypothetical protein n=1 Tax=Streptomyces sp. NPDC090127 TaxID=3365953 RepID=UPI00381B4B71